MPSEAEDMVAVAGAIARITGYGEIHIDAISRELGWNVERRRGRLGVLVRRLISLGYVAARAEDQARGAAPPRIVGLTTSGHGWLSTESR